MAKKMPEPAPELARAPEPARAPKLSAPAPPAPPAPAPPAPAPPVVREKDRQAEARELLDVVLAAEAGEKARSPLILRARQDLKRFLRGAKDPSPFWLAKTSYERATLDRSDPSAALAALYLALQDLVERTDS